MGVVAYAVVVALYLATVGDPKYEIRNFNAASCICTGNASSYAVSALIQGDSLKIWSSCILKTCHAIALR